MNLALFQKINNTSTSGCYKQRFTCNTIIVNCLLFTFLRKLIGPRYSIWEWVSTIFSIMSIKITNSVCCFKITSIFKIFLYRLARCSMGFFWHYFLISIYWIFFLFYKCQKELNLILKKLTFWKKIIWKREKWFIIACTIHLKISFLRRFFDRITLRCPI
jgi:hypothetical protein